MSPDPGPELSCGAALGPGAGLNPGRASIEGWCLLRRTTFSFASALSLIYDSAVKNRIPPFRESTLTPKQLIKNELYKRLDQPSFDDASFSPAQIAPFERI
jgi:hypothetical protein